MSQDGSGVSGREYKGMRYRLETIVHRQKAPLIRLQSGLSNPMSWCGVGGPEQCIENEPIGSVAFQFASVNFGYSAA